MEKIVVRGLTKVFPARHGSVAAPGPSVRSAPSSIAGTFADLVASGELLRHVLGIGLILIVIAEIVGARSGIGYMIWQAWTIFQVERMYVGLVVIAVLGWLAALLLDAAERLLVPWRPRR